MQNDTLLKGSIDEISIKQLVYSLIDHFKFIIKHAYVIVILAVVLGGLQYHKLNQIITTYPAYIKIFIQPQDIADENYNTLEKYATIATSKTLIEDVFFQPVEIDGHHDFIINHYLNAYYQLKPAEIEERIEPGFFFSETEKLDRTEAQVLQWVMEKVLQPSDDFSDGFISQSSDPNLGMIILNISTPQEQLSISILQIWSKKFMEFLTFHQSYSYNEAYSEFKTMTDSLSQSFKSNYSQLNRYKNQREHILKQDSIPSSSIQYLEKKIHQLEATIKIENTHYTLALEQEKVAQQDRALNSLFLRVIDQSSSSITPYQPSSIVGAIKYGIMGTILAVFILISIRLAQQFKAEFIKA